MHYVLSPRAQVDVESIWNYTVAKWGPAQAELYIRGIKEALEVIAIEPQRGQPGDDIRKGYRKYRVGSHIVFYKSTPTYIDVVRILHQRMDYNRHL